MNCFCGAICSIRCMIPVSVAMMKREVGCSVTARIMPSVDAMVRPSGLMSPRPDLVDELARAAALGVDQDLGVGVALPRRVEGLAPDAPVHVALAHPDLDPAVRPHPARVGAEEEVGEEEDAAIGRNRVDHVEDVAAGAAVVQLGLHLRGGVDVAHRDVIGKLRPPLPHLARP